MLWLHSLKVAQLLRSVACLHTNQSRSYLNHLVIRHIAEKSENSLLPNQTLFSLTIFNFKTIYFKSDEEQSLSIYEISVCIVYLRYTQQRMGSFIRTILNH